MSARRGWRTAAVLVLVGGATLAVGPSRAEEPPDPSAPGPALGRICTDLGLAAALPAECLTFDSGAVLLAAVCGHLGIDGTTCAGLTDGRPIDPAAVDAFAAGWVPRALALQDRLGRDLPLRDAPMAHTHNSFNSPQHGPSLTTLDPNQRYPLTDQLRMGFRALELDVHRFPHPAGDPTTGFQRVVVCHGQTQDVGGIAVHVGCSIDRLLGPVLDELRAFLDRPEHDDEVLLLYLQNELDGDPVAHGEAVAELDRALGPLVIRPQGTAPGECADLPVERSWAELVGGGARVLLVGNCGPGAWASWVFQRGDAWDERANTAGYPTFPACQADRTARGYDDHLIRVTEDRTWLSAVVGTPAPITADEVRSMVRCGVELIGLDRVGPHDPRLPALVWSWAPDEPSAAGACAAWGPDGRFRAAGCDQHRRPACRTADGWLVPEGAGPWAASGATCDAVGATFDVPRTGWDAERLRAAAPVGAELWLGYAVAAATGEWTPRLHAEAVDAAAGARVAPTPTPSGANAALPATGGGPSPLGGAVLAIASAGLAAAARPRPR